MVSAAPPAYNPYYFNNYQSQGGGLKPTAPPMPYNASSGYSYNGFFGDASGANQDRLGREMLEAVIVEKTNWVPRAAIPKDTLLNRGINFVSALFPKIYNPNDNKVKADLWLRAGELFYAEMTLDQDTLKYLEGLKKANSVFNDFLNSLNPDESDAEYCLARAVEMDATNPEIHFLRGKLMFAANNYSEALADFEKTYEVANNLENASSYRKKCFSALAKTCRGASYERLGFHDRALFDYIAAAKVDPNGTKGYEEALSRNFQILKFKTYKNQEELQACIEYDPYDPDFQIELANLKLNNNQQEEAVYLLNQAIYLSYYYKPQSLFRSAELAQQVAFVINNNIAAQRAS